jgi:hypothetical protein
MRELTAREKRTVRLGLAVVVIYLACFGGLQGWKSFSKKRADYQQLVRQAQSLRQEIQPYESKVLLVRKLMENFHLDPAKLTNRTVVAEASAAIQKAAMTSGVMVGAVREEYARGSTKELAIIKLEGNGPVPAMMAFLYRLESLGYPLIVDSVQIGSETGRPGGPMGPGGPMVATGPTGPSGPMAAMEAMPRMGPPGMLKLSLTIVILNFEQWKNEEMPNA